MRLTQFSSAIARMVFAVPPAQAWVRRRTTETVNIVYYHCVGERSAHYAEFHQGCTLDRFRSDLRFLCEHFTLTPLETLLKEPREETEKRPRLAITFDDGFDLNRPELLECLAEFKVSATTLVITSCLDNRHLMWRNKLSVVLDRTAPAVVVREYNGLMAEADMPAITQSNQVMSESFDWEMARKDGLATELWNRCGLGAVEDYLAEHRPYFTREGLKQWVGAGHTIGLHTRSHPRCSRLTRDEIEAEIVEPARQLKAEFGIEHLPFSYPFGDRLPREFEAEVIGAAGLTCALGIQGFSPVTTPALHLEREGLEGSGAHWAVIGKAALRGLRQSRRLQMETIPAG